MFRVLEVPPPAFPLLNEPMPVQTKTLRFPGIDLARIDVSMQCVVWIFRKSLIYQAKTRNLVMKFRLIISDGILVLREWRLWQGLQVSSQDS